MRTTIVRYKVKPARLDEHVALVKAVFEELSRSRPAGLRYSAVRAADGVSFTHISAIEASNNPLSALASFQNFQRGIADRCNEPPTPVEVSVVGDLPCSPRARRARESHSVPGRAAPF